jgi:hypothetical protein
MKGHIIFRLVMALVLLVVLTAGAVGLGLFAYNAGVTRGLADSGKLALPPAGAAPNYLYAAGPFFHYGFFGPGFGLLNCLFLLLGLGFIFMLVRGIMFVAFGRRHWGEAGGPNGLWARRWHGPWGHGPWGKDYPPMFDEWHRQAHTQDKPQEPPSSGPAQA